MLVPSAVRFESAVARHKVTVGLLAPQHVHGRDRIGIRDNRPSNDELAQGLLPVVLVVVDHTRLHVGVFVARILGRLGKGLDFGVSGSGLTEQ